jgi:ribonuclease HI
MPVAVATGIAGIAGAGASVYGSKKSSRAAKTAAQYQSNQANYAADLEAKAAAASLEFAKQQEAQRAKEFADTQARNKAIYDAEVTRDQGRYDQRQSGLAPFRQFGYGSLSQMAQPIPRTGSLGSMMG